MTAQAGIQAGIAAAGRAPAPGLAPEAGDAVREARDQLARTAQVAHLTNDPMAPFIDALSTLLGAQHRLFVDGAATIDASLRQAGPPLDAATLDRLSRELTARAGQWHAETAAAQARAHWRRDWAVATLAGLLLLGLGFLGGRWAASSGAEVLTGASFIAQVVSVNNPEDLRHYCYAHAVAQPGGGTICQLPPVWVLPPDRK